MIYSSHARVPQQYALPYLLQLLLGTVLGIQADVANRQPFPTFVLMLMAVVSYVWPSRLCLHLKGR